MSDKTKKPASPENSLGLSKIFTPCSSGKHLWFMEEDAKMCCRDFKRVVVTDPQDADTWLYIFGFGYKWVPEDDPRKAVNRAKLYF